METLPSEGETNARGKSKTKLKVALRMLTASTTISWKIKLELVLTKKAELPSVRKSPVFLLIHFRWHLKHQTIILSYPPHWYINSYSTYERQHQFILTCI